MKLIFLFINSLITIPVGLFWIAAPHAGLYIVVIFFGSFITTFTVALIFPTFFAFRKSITWNEAFIIAGFPAVFWMLFWIILSFTF